MAELRAPKPKDSTTTLTVSQTVSEIVFRADVTATVGGGPAPTGTVTFRDGSTVIQAVDINGSYSSATSPGSVTATYNGDSRYNPSTSQTLRPPYV